MINCAHTPGCHRFSSGNATAVGGKCPLRVSQLFPAHLASCVPSSCQVDDAPQGTAGVGRGKQSPWLKLEGLRLQDGLGTARGVMRTLLQPCAGAGSSDPTGHGLSWHCRLAGHSHTTPHSIPLWEVQAPSLLSPWALCAILAFLLPGQKHSWTLRVGHIALTMCCHHGHLGEILHKSSCLPGCPFSTSSSLTQSYFPFYSLIKGIIQK